MNIQLPIPVSSFSHKKNSNSKGPLNDLSTFRSFTTVFPLFEQLALP